MTGRTIPGEIDPETLPLLPRDQIVALMSKPLKAEYRSVEAKLGEEERRSLLTEHDLGKRTSRLRSDEAQYGSRAVELVAAACGVDPSRLYRAARFFECFPDRKEVEKLMARRGAGGYRFGWAHVLQLLPVEDAGRRAEFIRGFFPRAALGPSAGPRDSGEPRQRRRAAPPHHALTPGHQERARAAPGDGGATPREPRYHPAAVRLRAAEPTISGAR